ncbi:ComEA family DNA-binding protein [Microbacterium sp. 11MF]|uniref:ComEA family DNA-binding protein n=1 Tax=Microbacterium sp. 11MF TaxID=1169146 RepID=UPI00036C3388|nr:helix-hairpin-helix domain-containing protein [Microbacterium sp. 11MF]
MSTPARDSAVPSWGWLLGVSSWLLLVFFGPGSAWIGFLIVGLVSRRRAAFVATAVSGLLYISVITELWGGLTSMVNAVAHLGGIVFALILNPGWLRSRWEARTSRGAARTSTHGSRGRRSTQRSTKRPTTAASSGSARSAASTRSAAPTRSTEATRLAASVGASSADLLQTAEPAEPVDVQNATADELAELPGLTRTKARRAVRTRGKNGGFTSLEDFGEAAGLQPHEIVRLRSVATCSPRPRGERRFGRRVDL